MSSNHHQRLSVLEQEVQSMGTVRSYSARLETYAYITRVRNILSSDNVHDFLDNQYTDNSILNNNNSTDTKDELGPYIQLIRTNQKRKTTNKQLSQQQQKGILSSSVLLTTTDNPMKKPNDRKEDETKEVQILVPIPRFSSVTSSSSSTSVVVHERLFTPSLSPPHYNVSSHPAQPNKITNIGERFTLNHIGYLPYHPYDSTLQNYDNYHVNTPPPNTDDDDDSSFTNIPLSTTTDLLHTVVEPTIQYWLKGYDTGIICTGQTGTGKTSLCFGSPALMIKGRPSVFMSVLTASLNHIRSCQRIELATKGSLATTVPSSFSSPSIPSLTNPIGSIPSSSSIYQNLKTPLSSSVQLYLSVWGIGLTNDIPIDLLAYYNPPYSTGSSSSTFFSSSSSLQHGSLHLLRINIENENDAVKVLTQALLRAQSFTSIPIPTDGTTTMVLGMDITRFPVVAGSLLSVPSLMHIFVRFELFAPLLKENSTKYHWATDTDIKNIPQLVRTFTLVDLVGLTTRDGLHTPSLRIPSPSVSNKGKNNSFLSMQYLSLGRQIKAINSAQRNAGIKLPFSSSPSTDIPNPPPSHQQAPIPSILQTERGQITYQQEIAAPYRKNRKLITSTIDPQIYPVFRSDQQNNRMDGTGLHIQPPPPNSLSSPSSTFLQAWYTDDDNNNNSSSNTTQRKEKGTGSSFLESYLAINEAGILASSLRDTALSRCLAPLLSGTVITKVIAMVSNSILDYQDTVQTLRLLQDMHNIVIKAVRCDIYSHMDNDKAQNILLRVPYSLQINPKLMTKEGISKITFTVTDWWNKHGKPIDIMMNTIPKEDTKDSVINQENQSTDNSSSNGKDRETGKKGGKPVEGGGGVRFVTNAKITTDSRSSKVPKPSIPPNKSTGYVPKGNERHHPPSSTHYVTNETILSNTVPVTTALPKPIVINEPISLPSIPRPSDPLNTTAPSLLNASLLSSPIPPTYPSNLPPRLSGNENGGNTIFSLAYQQELIRIQELSSQKSREFHSILWNGNPIVSTALPCIDNVAYPNKDPYYSNGQGKILNDTASSFSITENSTIISAPASLRKSKEDKHYSPVPLNREIPRSVPPSPIIAPLDPSQTNAVTTTVAESVENSQRRGSRYNPVPLGQVRLPTPTVTPPVIGLDTKEQEIIPDSIVQNNVDSSLSNTVSSVPSTEFKLVPYEEVNTPTTALPSTLLRTSTVSPLIPVVYTIVPTPTDDIIATSSNNNVSPNDESSVGERVVVSLNASANIPESTASPTIVTNTDTLVPSVDNPLKNNTVNATVSVPDKKPDYVPSPKRPGSRLSDIPVEVRPKALLRMSPSAAAHALLHSSSSSDDEKPKPSSQVSSSKRSNTSSPSGRGYSVNRRSPRSRLSKTSPRASPIDSGSRNSAKINSTDDEKEIENHPFGDPSLDRPASVHRVTSKASSVGRSTPPVVAITKSSPTAVPTPSKSLLSPSPFEVIRHTPSVQGTDKQDSFPITDANVSREFIEKNTRNNASLLLLQASTEVSITSDQHSDDNDRPGSSMSFHSSSTQYELSYDLNTNRATEAVRTSPINENDNDHESTTEKSTVSSKSSKEGSLGSSQGHEGDLDDTIHSQKQRQSINQSLSVSNNSDPRPSLILQRTLSKPTTPVPDGAGRERGSSTGSITSLPAVSESVKTAALRSPSTKPSNLSRPSSTIGKIDDMNQTIEELPFTPRPAMERLTPANDISEALFELAKGENYLASILTSYVQQASETETDVSVGPRIGIRNKGAYSDSSNETTDYEATETEPAEEDSSDASRKKGLPKLKSLPSILQGENKENDTHTLEPFPMVYPSIDTQDRPLPQLIKPSIDNLNISDTVSENEKKDSGTRNSTPLIPLSNGTEPLQVTEVTMPIELNIPALSVGDLDIDDIQTEVTDGAPLIVMPPLKNDETNELVQATESNIPALSADDLDTDDIQTEVTDGVPSIVMPPLKNDETNELIQSIVFQQSQLYVPPPPPYTTTSTISLPSSRRTSLTKGLQLAVISPLPPSPPPPPILGTDAPPTSMSPLRGRSPLREDKAVETDLSFLSSLSTSTVSEDNTDDNGVLDTSVLRSFVSDDNNDSINPIYPPHNGIDGTLTARYAHVSPSRVDKPARAYTQTVITDDFDLANSKLSTLEGTRSGKEAAELAKLSTAVINEYEIAYREVAETEELLYTLEKEDKKNEEFEPNRKILPFATTSEVNHLRRSVSPTTSKGSRIKDLSPFRSSEVTEEINDISVTNIVSVATTPVNTSTKAYSGTNTPSTVFEASSSLPYVAPLPSSALAAARALTSSLLSAPPASLTNSTLSLSSSSSLSTPPSRLVSSAFTPNYRQSSSLTVPKSEQQQTAESLLNTAASARRFANELRSSSSRGTSTSSTPSSSNSSSTENNANLDESLINELLQPPVPERPASVQRTMSSTSRTASQKNSLTKG